MENTVTMVFGMLAGCVVGTAVTLSWQCFKAYKKETDSRFETAVNFQIEYKKLL